MTAQGKRIAWIGTGVMGAPMAGHLLAAGYELRVHTRSPAKARALLERGARWAESPAEAADGADAAFSMVGYPEDVEAVHLGPAGTLAADRRPPLIVDMTTSRPSLAVRLHREAASGGGAAVDAPVSGGDVGAREARLSIMVGAEPAAFEAARPLLEILGSRIVHQGGPGTGQHAKLVNQVLVASTMIGAAEGLLYAGRAGLDPRRLLEAVGSGAAGSWTIDHLAPRMVRRDFGPGFYVEHLIKDLTIALDESARLGLAMPGLALVRQLYEAVRVLRGGAGGRLGTQALLLALERLNGVDEGVFREGTCPTPDG